MSFKEEANKFKTAIKPANLPIVVTPDNKEKVQQLVKEGKGYMESKQSLKGKTYYVFAWYE